MAFAAKYEHIVRENEPMSAYCWVQMGGHAKYFAEPNSVDDLCGLIAEASRQALPIRLLGDGSNILVRDEGVDALVIRLATAELCKIELAGTRLNARAGARLNHVVSAAAGAGLAGLEHLAGIPGAIGAAVASNAGVVNDDIGNYVTSVLVVDRDGRTERRPREHMQFGFRRSNLEDAWIAEVELTLEAGETADITRRMHSNRIIRRASQPPSGSRVAQAWVEPSGTNLAEIFDTAGVKGTREGEVALSVQFPGFIVASGDASSAEVLALISRVTRAVLAKTGIQLQSQLKIW